jgi:hypothetical protein
VNLISTLTTQIAVLVLPYVPQFASYVQRSLTRLSSLYDALQSVARAEEALDASRLALTAIAARGLALESDFAAYDTLRANLFAAQTRLHVTVIRTFSSVPGGSTILARVPVPQFAPAVPRPARFAPKGSFPETFVNPVAWGSTNLEARPAGSRTVSGLGRAGTHGLGLVPAAWAGIVIAVIGVGVLVGYVLWGNSEDAARVLVPEAQAELTRRMWTDRQNVYNDCLARGGTPESCSGISQTVVPEVDLSAQQQALATEQQARASQWTTFAWILGIAVVGFVAFKVVRSRSESTAIVPTRVRSVRGLRGPRRVGDLHGPSTYNLEIA